MGSLGHVAVPGTAIWLKDFRAPPARPGAFWGGLDGWWLVPHRGSLFGMRSGSRLEHAGAHAMVLVRYTGVCMGGGPSEPLLVYWVRRVRSRFDALAGMLGSFLEYLAGSLVGILSPV